MDRPSATTGRPALSPWAPSPAGVAPLAALTLLSLGVLAAVVTGIALWVPTEADHPDDLVLIGVISGTASVTAWWAAARALRKGSPVAGWASLVGALMSIGFAASIGGHVDERRLATAAGVAGGLAIAVAAATLARALARQALPGSPASTSSGSLVEWAFDRYAAIQIRGGLSKLATRWVEWLAMAAGALEAIGRVSTVAESARDRRRVLLAGLRGAVLPRSRVPVRLALAWRGTALELDVRESTDVQVISEVLRGEYDVELDRPPDTILDLGAHIGLVSLDFALRWPGAAVLSVEPDPGNFRMLERNLAAFPNVTPLHAAVAREPGQGVLHAAQHPWDSSLRHRSPGSVPVPVACHSLDSLVLGLGVDRVDLVKLDIEGAEHEVLAGSRLLGRIGTLVGEFHEDQAGVRPERFFSLFADHELEVRRTAPFHYSFRARLRSA